LQIRACAAPSGPWCGVPAWCGAVREGEAETRPRLPAVFRVSPPPTGHRELLQALRTGVVAYLTAARMCTLPLEALQRMREAGGAPTVGVSSALNPIVAVSRGRVAHEHDERARE
jgi:hypothetical protein